MTCQTTIIDTEDIQDYAPVALDFCALKQYSAYLLVHSIYLDYDINCDPNGFPLLVSTLCDLCYTPLFESTRK
jgi:hypothetical protein